MDTTTLSKRTFEILDLAHDGAAVLDEGTMPPAIVGWRLEQLQAALSEAARLEHEHAQGQVVQRIAQATQEIEATINEIEAVLHRRATIYDYVARFGMVTAVGWAALVAAFVVLGSLAWSGLFALSAGIIGVRMSARCKDAIDQRIHEESLPIRLSLAWNKLAVAENSLHHQKRD